MALNGEECMVTEWEAHEAFGTIMGYSLLHPFEDCESISMYPLVQFAVREQTESEKPNYFHQSVNLVRRKYPWGRGRREQSESLSEVPITCAKLHAAWQRDARCRISD